MRFASLCILAWKRPEMLWTCIDSLRKTADFPYEIIVNLDANDFSENTSNLVTLLSENKISKLILSNGMNRGVGRSFANCLGMAEGNYVFKVDTDLVFKPGWLSTAVGILDKNSDIGTVSLFNYRHYAATDERFNIDLNEHRQDCFIVDDFVSSIYGCRRHEIQEIIDRLGKVPDDGLHQLFGKKLAITKEDYVENQGFGIGRSVYVIADEHGQPTTQKMYDEPLIFQGDKKE